MMITSRLHPSYHINKYLWDFFLDSYYGGPHYLNTQLFKYYKEGPKEFDLRKERAYRENYCKNIVDIINSYIFKEQATRKTTNKKLDDFYKDFDGAGSDVSQFMKKVSTKSSVLGRTYVVVDKTSLSDEERTGTFADNLKTKPYCYTVNPQDVPDVAFDKFGNIKWIIIREWNREDDDPFNDSGDLSLQYRLWMPGEWQLYDESGDMIDSGQTGIDCVPVVYVDSGESISELNSTGLLFDIAYLDRSIYNNYSRLDAIIADQTFSQLIFPVEGLLVQEMMTDETMREQFLTLATNRILFYSASCEAKPEYISPDASQANFILETIKHQINQIYASIGLQPIASSSYASGTSKQWDFDKLNKILAGKSSNLEIAERKILNIFNQWTGANATATINYPNDFDIRSLSDELLLAQEFSLLDISQTFNSEIKKNLVLKSLPKLDQKTMQTIFDEIDMKAKEFDESEEVFDFDNSSNTEEKDKMNQMEQTKLQTEARYQN